MASGSFPSRGRSLGRESRSSVGGIHRAQQGVFEILPRDPAPGIQQEGQMQKTLRVVTPWSIGCASGGPVGPTLGGV